MAPLEADCRDRVAGQRSPADGPGVVTGEDENLVAEREQPLDRLVELAGEGQWIAACVEVRPADVADEQ